MDKVLELSKKDYSNISTAYVQEVTLENRWKVFHRIPELIDAERILAFLDRLRRRMRDGNDLFFLDQTAMAVGRRHPEVTHRVAQLRGRFFDHIPPPPKELFETVKTCDGRVPLWREIPAGSFLMGSPRGNESERPRHRVTLTSSFHMAAVPVTWEQYAAFDPGYAEARPRPPCHPVEVSWWEAMAFCRWLATAYPGARLPTEEEWEYAARAGTSTRYWSGNSKKELARVGWYQKNSGGKPHRVGEKPANGWGLYDVHGNVWEWILSEWTESYTGREGGVAHRPASVSVDESTASTASTAPLSEIIHGRRVKRGGCFGDTADRACAAYRPRCVELENQGLRVVLPGRSELLTVDP